MAVKMVPCLEKAGEVGRFLRPFQVLFANFIGLKDNPLGRVVVVGDFDEFL